MLDSIPWREIAELLLAVVAVAYPVATGGRSQWAEASRVSAHTCINLINMCGVTLGSVPVWWMSGNKTLASRVCCVLNWGVGKWFPARCDEVVYG